MLKKLLAVLLIASMMLVGFAFAEEAEVVEHQPVAIIYTNDVHCDIDGNIGYAGLAAYKKALADNGYVTELVDIGDAVQGAAVGTISKGSYIIDIMNYVGYDVATIGNHEFDYGMGNFMDLANNSARFDYVCCNFTDLNGNPLFEPYVIRELGGWKVAFVGISTPETFTKSTPTFFQDKNGNYIYSFNGGNNGQDLFDVVQKNVDAAIADGAEIVVALAHLGTEFIAPDKPWTSSDVITNTTGIDIVLDGHSHSTIPGETVLNKDGEAVILTSTGTQLDSVGVLTIDADEEGNPVFGTKLHDEALFQDEKTAGFVAAIISQYDALLKKVVAHTDVDLIINDPTAVDDSGKPVRIIRTQETNLGDLCADGYRVVTGADIGVVNGGGIRATLPAGDITYEQIIAVHPYGNKLCVVETTGQQILDLLECSVSRLPAENGGFQHVSGLTFEINANIPSPVIWDENAEFAGVEGERRVQNVLVAGEPIDPEKTYTLASHNYMLKDGGDGLNMFKGDKLLQDETMLDNQVLITYITENLGGNVGADYAEPYGQGRIVFVD